MFVSTKNQTCTKRDERLAVNGLGARQLSDYAPPKLAPQQVAQLGRVTMVGLVLLCEKKIESPPKGNHVRPILCPKN